MALATKGQGSQKRNGADKEAPGSSGDSEAGRVRVQVGPPRGRHSLGAAPALALWGNGLVTWARDHSFEGPCRRLGVQTWCRVTVPV